VELTHLSGTAIARYTGAQMSAQPAAAEIIGNYRIERSLAQAS